MLKRKTGKMHFWKIVKNNRESLEIPLPGHTILKYSKGDIVHAKGPKGGKINARRRNPIKHRRIMNSGIYVYTKRPSYFLRKLTPRYRILRVECHVDDLLGSNFNCACFAKVKVLT